MSWGAQNRSKDAKIPSAGRGMSEKPELDCRPIQPYATSSSAYVCFDEEDPITKEQGGRDGGGSCAGDQVFVLLCCDLSPWQAPTAKVLLLLRELHQKKAHREPVHASALFGTR
jgi:hypothetical protein